MYVHCIGFTGLVTKPIKEARKDGFEGFLRGVGMGIVGVAVKPVLGLTDGITSVASSIQNRVDIPLMTHTIHRPARALEVSSKDSTSLALVPLNLDAAQAKEFITQRAESHRYQDSFIAYIPLDDEGIQSVILSTLYVFWKRKENLWGRTWSNISHCVYQQSTVAIVLYGGGEQNKRAEVPCTKLSYAYKLYTMMFQNSFRMGYPALTLPVDIAIAAYQATQKDPPQAFTIPLLHSELSLDGSLDKYMFGSVNSMEFPSLSGSESDVLKRAEASVGNSSSGLSWRDLDVRLYRAVWEWDCVHYGLSVSRCCLVTIINLSHDTLQLTRIQLIMGRGFKILGSDATGYDREYKLLRSGGRVSVLVYGSNPTPLDISHLKLAIYCTGVKLIVASTQAETLCEGRRGYSAGFVEKTSTEWWCKYTILVH